jgi:hypothetical protein
MKLRLKLATTLFTIFVSHGSAHSSSEFKKYLPHLRCAENSSCTDTSLSKALRQKTAIGQLDRCERYAPTRDINETISICKSVSENNSIPITQRAKALVKLGHAYMRVDINTLGFKATWHLPIFMKS